MVSVIPYAKVLNAGEEVDCIFIKFSGFNPTILVHEEYCVNPGCSCTDALLRFIELSDDGLSLKDGATPQQVAGTAYEGTYIHKKDGHYYFFASIGSCCEGLKSTYTTVVGRSDNLFGPYVDKNGGSMMDNKHEVLIQKSNSFVGTGHNSEIVTDNAGNDWFFYHAVSTKKPEGRVLMLDKISWEDGWPTVEGSVASTEAEKPKF